MKKESFERAKWIPICIIAIILMIIYKTLDNIGQITSAIGNFLFIISPLLYGILFTYFLYTPYHAIEKLLLKSKLKFISKRARGISTLLVFLVLILVVVLILVFFLPSIFSNIVELVGSIPEYIDNILEYFNNLPADSILNSFDIANTITSYAEHILPTVMDPSVIAPIASGVMSFFGEIFSVTMGLFISLYILLDMKNISEFFKRLNKAVFKREDRITKTAKYFSQINKVLFTFIASKGLDSLINFTVATTVLFIFGVPYAPLLGLIAGLFNFIPFIGSIISAFIITLITLLARDFNTAIYVMASLLIFHQIDGNFIEPKIMKSALKISPILVIVAVVAGGAYFGIVGMFLAVPVSVIIMQLILEYIASTEHGEADGEAAVDVAAEPVDEAVSDGGVAAAAEPVGEAVSDGGVAAAVEPVDEADI